MAHGYLSTQENASLCHRLGIECVYLQPTAPPDHTYTNWLQQRDVTTDITLLQQQIAEFERLVAHYRQLQLQKQKQKQLDPLVAKDDDDAFAEQAQNGEKEETNWTPPSGLEGDDGDDDVRLNQHPWQLTVRKHGLSIETGIRTFSDLVFFLTAPSSPSTLLIGSPVSDPGKHLQRLMPMWLLRRGTFEIIRQMLDSTSSKSANATKRNPLLLTAAPATLDDAALNALCLPLLHALFACHFSYHVLLHRATFYAWFVDPVDASDLISSPVICALCAYALVIPCQHTRQLVLRDQQEAAARAFYERAHDLVCFDDVSMGSLITLTFMALFHVKTYNRADAALYLDMAFRMRHLWLDDGGASVSSAPEKRDPRMQELFKRVHWAMLRVAVSLEFMANRRGVPMDVSKKRATNKAEATPQPHPVARLLREQHQQFVRTALPDEPKRVQATLRMHHVTFEMTKILSRFIQRVRWGKSDAIDVPLLTETEADYAQFYAQVPTHLRMDLKPLLALTTSGNENLPAALRRLLDQRFVASDGSVRHEQLPKLFLAIHYVQGLISLYEPFFPDLQDAHRARLLGLLDEQGLPIVHSSLSSSSSSKPVDPSSDTMPSMTLSPSSSSSASSQNEANQKPAPPLLPQSPQPSPPLSPTSVAMVPVQQLAHERCTQAATLLVFFLEYTQHLGFACDIDISLLLSPWDVHLRNACLGQEMNDAAAFLSTQLISRARQSLLQCFSILHHGCFFNFAQAPLIDYFDHIEHTLCASLHRSPSNPIYPSV
ncbi:hypothetical protein BC940DRAFT_337125 [Gongronella butleri]|nr:hypothetical protein BC940DRAFT_337125 [Gongronella butleri]